MELVGTRGPDLHVLPAHLYSVDTRPPRCSPKRIMAITIPRRFWRKSPCTLPCQLTNLVHHLQIPHASQSFLSVTKMLGHEIFVAIAELLSTALGKYLNPSCEPPMYDLHDSDGCRRHTGRRMANIRYVVEAARIDHSGERRDLPWADGASRGAATRDGTTRGGEIRAR